MAPLGPASVAIFVVVGLVVAVATYRRPAYGIAALLIFDPFDYAHALGALPTSLTLEKVALLATALGLLARRASLRPLLSRAGLPLAVGAVAIVVATALAATQADYHAPALREVLKAVEYAAIFAVALVAFVDDPQQRSIENALVAATIVVSVAALLQAAAGGAPSGIYLGGRVVPRIAGPLEGPNQLAGYYDIAIPFLLAIAFSRGKADIALLAALAIAAVSDLLTSSRAGIAATLTATAIVVAVARPRWSALRFVTIAGSVGFAVLGALVAMGTLSRFANFADADRPTGLGTRAELWNAALVLWRRHPWLGVGGGNYELELPRAGVTDAQTHANSLYLQSLAEGGIVLFSATVGTLVAALIVMGRNAARVPYALGALGATVALALHQVFDLMLFFPKVGGFWWIALALGAGAIVVGERNERQRDGGRTARAA
jgi:O-antigen ligase